LIEGTLIIGHQLDSTDDVPQIELSKIARHVMSATGLTEANPGTLRKALNPSFQDRAIASYEEEYNGLTSMDTMEVITATKYQTPKKASNVIPTMCLSTVKTNENNKPV
jgi:cytochrome P450